MSARLQAVEVRALARIEACRCCGSGNIETVWDLGVQPIANDLKPPGFNPAQETVFPLEVCFCADCAVMQITETVSSDVLFRGDYPYFSSVSADLMKHSRQHVLSLLEEFHLGPEHLVIEVASNDGYLLKNFVDAGPQVLGIDPASGPARAAQSAGIPTINDFFNKELGQSLAKAGKLADVLLANNVAAHVDGINDFIQGIGAALKECGVAELEVAYLLDLVNRKAFDTVYHEHLFYHSLLGLKGLFFRNGLYLNDAQRLEIHGGSVRVRVSKIPGESERLAELLKDEYSLGMDRVEFYRGFGQQAELVRTKLQSLLRGIKERGERVVAYGAAAKGATLLNYVRFPTGTIDYVVDLNRHKVGKLMPGVMLPILPVETLSADPPDFVLLLAWNFAREIILQQKDLMKSGTRFIIPVPEPRIVTTLQEV